MQPAAAARRSCSLPPRRGRRDDGRLQSGALTSSRLTSKEVDIGVVAEADEDRFRMERHAESVQHLVLDVARQTDDVPRGGAAAIDDRQRMLRREADRAVDMAPREPALL